MLKSLQKRALRCQKHSNNCMIFKGMVREWFEKLRETDAQSFDESPTKKAQSSAPAKFQLAAARGSAFATMSRVLILGNEWNGRGSRAKPSAYCFNSAQVRMMIAEAGMRRQPNRRQLPPGILAAKFGGFSKGKPAVASHSYFVSDGRADSARVREQARCRPLVTRKEFSYVPVGFVLERSVSVPNATVNFKPKSPARLSGTGAQGLRIYSVACGEPGTSAAAVESIEPVKSVGLADLTSLPLRQLRQ